MSDAADRIGKHVREQRAREARLEELARAGEAGADVTALAAELRVDADAVRSAHAPARALSATARGLRRRAVFYPPLLAAAAVAGLWLQSQLGSLRSGQLELARYQLEVRGDAASERSAEPVLPAQPSLPVAPLRLAAGQHITLLLRPERAVEGGVTARLRLLDEGLSADLPVDVSAAPEGALELAATLPPLPAQGELEVLVGRPSVLSPLPASPLADRGPGWQRFVLPFQRRE